MTNLDKFYSDADRLMKRSAVPGNGLSAGALAQELRRLFLSWARDYGNLGTDLADYWVSAYESSLGTEEGRKNGVEWFGALLALLGGEFSPAMDFSHRDWEEIRDTVNAEADDMDIDLLSSIMTVIVERGKA
jgi:hypothetical protein